jgi:hypothetical protein
MNPEGFGKGSKRAKLRGYGHMAALERTAEVPKKFRSDPNCTNTEKNCNLFQITNLLEQYGTTSKTMR